MLINPDATIDALLGAILSRMDRLQISLDAWCVAGDSDVQVQEVVGPLEPLAEEALQLLRVVQQRVALAGRSS